MKPNAPKSEAESASLAPGGSAQASFAPDDPQPGDTYQEGPYLVFTAQYHLRRGYCCNSGCRHCPYK